MKQYVFGYGSLVDPAEIALTLGHATNIVYPVYLNGYTRDWSVVVDNLAMPRRFKVTSTGLEPKLVVALNVYKSNKPTNPNGIIFEVTDNDLKQMDIRESHYERIDVTADITGAPDGIVYTYSGLTHHILSADETAITDIILPGSYMDVVEKGFAALGEDMLAEYRASTVVSAVPVFESILQ